MARIIFSMVFILITGVLLPCTHGDTWSPAASMKNARYGHTATLLSGGQVLVAGGYDGGNDLASADAGKPELAEKLRHVAEVEGSASGLSGVREW